MSTPPRRAGIYNRASTEEQVEHGYNLKGDTERCRERIERDNDLLYVDTYEDPARSGGDLTDPSTSAC